MTPAMIYHRRVTAAAKGKYVLQVLLVLANAQNVFINVSWKTDSIAANLNVKHFMKTARTNVKNAALIIAISVKP